MELYSRNDFTGFQFGEKHSVKDFEVYRVSEGSRYVENYLPSMTEKVVNVPGQNGSLYFGTEYQNKTFNVNLAFDHLTEQNLRAFKSWLNGVQIQELIFDEEPYKVWYAKVTGSPSLKYICFSEGGRRIYKGEGTVQFTTYVPYAHTPKKLWMTDTDTNLPKYAEADGRIVNNYTPSYYPSIGEWRNTANLAEDATEVNQYINNYGDLPTWFEVTKPTIQANKSINIAGNIITIKEAASNFTWNSKTGLVSGEVNGILRPLQYTGTSYCTIPITTKNSITYKIPAGCTLKYDFLYL